jgi:DNA modification methylase
MSLVTKIYNENCLDTMSVMSDCFIDLIFTDPPYGLGSKIIIRSDGKPDYAKATDFMSKWDMPTGNFWETWFKEAFRILKFGGHCLMFGMDRQLLIYKYYATLAGFNENQSLYWYQAQGFPKSSDLSKNLDKHQGKIGKNVLEVKRSIKRLYKDKGMTLERFNTACGFEASGYLRESSTWSNVLPSSEKWEKIKEVIGCGKFLDEVFSEAEREIIGMSSQKRGKGKTVDYGIDRDGFDEITAPTTDLAKKYSGYKYSIAPLKQTNETILVFQKPYKTGSCMHDILAMESGDKIITCGALDIDGGRVPVDKVRDKSQLRMINRSKKENDDGWGMNNNSSDVYPVIREEGRYPSQVFCNDESAELIDKQSGIKTSCKSKSVHPAYGDSFKFGGGVSSPENQYSDTGGCSKVLHKCNFEPEELKEVGCSSSGDSTITCGALNIDGGRVPIDKIRDKSQLRTMVRGVKEEKDVWGINNNKVPETLQVVREDGRYPAQTFCNSDASELLDNQSGERPSGKSNNNAEVGVSGNATPLRRGKLVSRNDTGGCSKVLDRCDYENEEYDIYNYCPKVSSKERGDSKHPTMKPISLITKILKLFIIPNQQVVYDPFTGTGSTGIACVTHKRNFIGSEISEEYCKIAEKRIADAK